MAETGEPPTMGQVGQRVGLARTSVYQYFASTEQLFAAVAAVAFPEWLGGVLNRVSAAPTPGERVWSYIEANIDILSSPEHAVAQVLMRVCAPQDLQAPMKDFHAQLQELLRQALSDISEPEPEAMATLIDAIVMHVTHELRNADPVQDPEAHSRSISLLRRLLGDYLQLQP